MRLKLILLLLPLSLQAGILDPTAYRFRSGAFTPATCTPRDVFFNTVSTTFLGCSVLNTWSTFGFDPSVLSGSYFALAGSNAILAGTGNTCTSSATTGCWVLPGIARPSAATIGTVSVDLAGNLEFVSAAGPTWSRLVTLDGTQTLTNKSLSIGQVTGLGTNVATFLATPNGVNFNAMISGGGVPVVPGSHSTAYTTVLADCGSGLLHPTADNNARTFTIDSNANVACPVGTMISFVNQINTLTIAITSDTLQLAGSATTGSRTLAAGGIATAWKVTATLWFISGSGLT